ncbi:MAG: hypothetical protein DMF63_00525 [Acidobacteria bacterium]|nr:MAG: hypothetical protein DMF63_00525 [Acidobacteriota bacterium]
MRKIGKARRKEIAERLTAEVRDEMVSEMSEIREELLKLKTRVEEFRNKFHYVDELAGIYPEYLANLAAGEEQSIEHLENFYAEIEGTETPKQKQQKAEAEEVEKKKDGMHGWLGTRN